MQYTGFFHVACHSITLNAILSASILHSITFAVQTDQVFPSTHLVGSAQYTQSHCIVIRGAHNLGYYHPKEDTKISSHYFVRPYVNNAQTV